MPPAIASIVVVMLAHSDRAVATIVSRVAAHGTFVVVASAVRIGPVSGVGGTVTGSSGRSTPPESPNARPVANWSSRVAFALDAR